MVVAYQKTFDPPVYDNHDIILVHFSRIPQAAYHPTRAVRYALLGPYADRGLNF